MSFGLSEGHTMKLDRFIEKRPTGDAKQIAVAAAEGKEVLQAINDARKLGLVDPILVGDADKIKAIIAENGFDLTDCEIVGRADHKSAAETAVELVKSGDAKVLMKGVLVSSILMRAILNKETGIRQSNTLNIVSVIDSPLMDRLLLLSDAGMVMYPELEQKIDIINNCVKVARNIGIENPKVACLAALEQVNSKMPPTMDAALLAMMSQRGQFKNCVVDGPYQLDLAICPHAVEEKGLPTNSPVAGHADILLVPNIETGNIVNKALRYLGGCSIAGLMAGAAVPVVMSSRADSPKNKLYSIGYAIAAAD